jgi:hypothetical protein
MPRVTIGSLCVSVLPVQNLSLLFFQKLQAFMFSKQRAKIFLTMNETIFKFDIYSNVHDSEKENVSNT